MENRINQNATWEYIVQRYCEFKVLRPQSEKNYKRYIESFSRFFGDEFIDINSLTIEKIMTFRSFF